MDYAGMSVLEYHTGVSDAGRAERHAKIAQAAVDAAKKSRGRGEAPADLEERFVRAWHNPAAPMNLDVAMPIAPQLRETFYSIKAFGKMFLPEAFSKPFSPEHEKLFRLLDDPTLRKFVIAAPRGFGKSTIIKAAIAQAIVWGKKKHIVVVSNSQAGAIRLTEDVKAMIEGSDAIRQIWPEGWASKDSWAKEVWTTKHRVRVVPLGMGSQVRGMNFDNTRPDFVIGDDLEDDKEVMNENIRRENLEYLEGPIGYLPDFSACYTIGIVGTVLHHDSLIIKKLEDPDWHAERMEICGDDLKSKWPEKFPDNVILEKYDAARRNGTLGVFMREWRGIPVADGAAFKSEWLKQYDETSAEFRAIEPELVNIILMDPAKTDNERSCESGVLAVGVHGKSGAIYVRECRAGKWDPDELFNQFFQLCRMYKARLAGIEVTGLARFITQPLEDRARLERWHGIFEWIQAKGKKEERIAALIPYYSRGLVFHNRQNCEQLEGQIIGFPFSKRLDLADPLAYIVPMLETNRLLFLKDYKDYEDPKLLHEEMEKVGATGRMRRAA